MMECNVRKANAMTFHGVINETVDNLHEIWGKMGFDEKVKKGRLETAVRHVKNLMDAMVAEEETMMRKTRESIGVLRMKLEKLCEELTVTEPKISEHLTMLQEEQLLRTKVESLKSEKNERMTKFDDLHGKENKLCEQLAEIPYYIPSDTVPTQQQLKELEAHVNKLQIEKEKRALEFNKMKTKICALHTEMESDPETSLAHDVVCEDAEGFMLTATRMKALNSLHEELVHRSDEMKFEVEDLWDRLKALWSRLETPEIEREAFSLDKTGHGKKLIADLKSEIASCEELKLQNIHKFIAGIRTELVSWWDKCFFSPERRNGFTVYYEDNFTEALLDAHEQELERTREYFYKHRDILDKISRREELFNTMKEFDSKASDPNRFFNDRGGRLLKEEKQRKKILKDLPKMEEEVAQFIMDWEKSNGADFYVKGFKFPQYVICQWDEFNSHKEKEKTDRMKAKSKQTQEEMMFGSKSALVTPGKRKPGAPPTTPMRTPLKARKLNGLVKTPNTTSRLLPVSRLQHTTVFHSPLYTSTAKTPMTSSIKKRRSGRLMKKAATERKSTFSQRRRSRDIFSHTTVSSEGTSASLASTCSYNDFAKHMSFSKTSSPETSTASSYASYSSKTGLTRPNCRSSVAPPSTPVSTGPRR